MRPEQKTRPPGVFARLSFCNNGSRGRREPLAGADGVGEAGRETGEPSEARADVMARTAAPQPAAGVKNFSPATPPTISAMQAKRAAVAGSFRTSMPSRAVPTAPMPVQTA